MLILDDGECVQFKFGLRWQLEYRLGDRIEFAEDKTGEQGQHEISGIGMHGSHTYYALRFDNGVIAAARKISEAEYERLREAERR